MDRHGAVRAQGGFGLLQSHRRPRVTNAWILAAAAFAPTPSSRESAGVGQDMGQGTNEPGRPAAAHAAHEQELLRSLRETETRRSLRTLFLVLAPILVLLGFVHLLTLPAQDALLNAGAVWTLAVAVLIVRFGPLDLGADARWALPAGTLVAVLVAGGTWLLLHTVGEQVHVVYSAVLLLGGAFFLFSVPVYVVVVAASFGGFIAAMTHHGYDEHWLHAGIPLGLSAVLGGIVLSTRVRSLRWAAHLRHRDELQKTSIGRSFQQAQVLETQARALAESAFEGIIIHRDQIVLDLNEAAAEIFAIARTQALGRHLHGFFMQEKDMKLAHQLGPSSASDTRSLVWHLHDQRTLEVEARTRTIPYKGGAAEVIVVRDVTQQHRDQREREAIRNRLESILESVGEGVYGVDREGKVLFANRAAARMLGVERGEVVGIDAHATFHHTKRSHEPYPAVECPVATALREGKVVQVDDEVYWRSDGSSFPVCYVASPLIEGDEPHGAVVVFQDATQREEMDRMKDELISVVGHELKTPLSSIHGSLRLIEGTQDGSLPSEVSRLVKIASRNSGRLTRLVNDLLDVERMNAGRLELEPVPVRARALVEDAVAAIGTLTDGQGVTIESTGPDVAFVGDRDRLIQALTNLLSNAVKYSDPGGKVRVRTRSLTDQVRFEVRDEGPGIPQEMHGRLFQRFFQLDSSDSRAKGGSGLGLVITRSIVEAHKGEVGLESTEGEGSTFFIQLPVHDDGRERARPSG